VGHREGPELEVLLIGSKAAPELAGKAVRLIRVWLRALALIQRTDREWKSGNTPVRYWRIEQSLLEQWRNKGGV